MTSRSFKEKRKLQHTRIALASASRAAKTALTRINRGMGPAGSMAGVQMAMARRNLPARLTGNRQEVKSSDWPLVGAMSQLNPSQAVALNQNSIVYTLNLIQEGSSFYNRIGRKIMMRSLHLIGSFQRINGGGVLGLHEYLRILVVYDRQTNGAVPTIADILTDYDQSGGTFTGAKSNLNMNNSERFQVLRDFRYCVIDNTDGALTELSTGMTDFNNDRVNMNEFIRLNNLETHYKASTNPSVVGDITTGGLFLVGFGNQVAGTEGYQLNAKARLRFHDT